MIAVRTFPDESSMSHILRPMRWEWLEAGSQRSNLTSSISGEVRSSPAQRTSDDHFGTSGSYQSRTNGNYSITSSAREIKVGEKASPIERAVRRLIASLISVGSSNGNCATFAPFKIRST